jgi:hypothetical protein
MDPSWKLCPVCIAPLKGWLVRLGEKHTGEVYTIHEGKSFIGSGAECEIRILGGNLARQHAFLVVSDICSIVDMGNGEPLKINNAVLVKSALIDGDVLLLGDFSFKIKLL